MKKYLSLVLISMFVLTGAVHAATLEVSPKVTHRFFDDVNDATGVGVEANVHGLFPAVPLVALTSVEQISAEKDGIDGNATIWSLGLGYDYAVPQAKGLTIRPYGSLDFADIGVDGPLEASNDTGRTLGVQARYALNDSATAFVGLSKQWMDTHVRTEGFDDKVNLGNVGLTAGFSFSF